MTLIVEQYLTELHEDKNHKYEYLEEQFGTLDIINTILDDSLCQKKQKKFNLKLLICIFLHKRTDITVLVPQLANVFNKDYQLTADLIVKAAELDLLDYDPSTEKFIVRYVLDKDSQKALDKFKYPSPLLVEPKEVISNKSCGYHTYDSPIILQSINYHDKDVCLDFINKINRIKYKLNLDACHNTQDKHKRKLKRKTHESLEEYMSKKKQHNIYISESKGIIDNMGNRPFYLTNRYDKRGRHYCNGYSVNTQGNNWNKACINFYNNEIVNT